MPGAGIGGWRNYRFLGGGYVRNAGALPCEDYTAVLRLDGVFALVDFFEPSTLR